MATKGEYYEVLREYGTGDLDMDVPIMVWVLCIVLPVFSALFMSFVIWTSYRKVIDGYHMEGREIDENTKRKKPMVIIFMILASFPAFYGILLIIILISQPDLTQDYQYRIVDMLGWIQGIPAAISILAQGILISYFMSGYMEEMEPDPKDMMKRSYSLGQRSAKERSPYSSSIVLYIMPQNVATFGLLITILTLTFGSIIGGSDPGLENGTTTSSEDASGGSITIDEENIDDVQTASWIFAGSAFLSILSGILPLKIKGRIMDKKVFKWRLMLGILGVIPVFIGFAIFLIMIAL